MRAAEAGFPSRTGPRRTRRVVLGVWAAIVLAALPFAANQAYKLSEQNSIDLAKRVQSRLGISGSDPGTAAGGRVNVHLVGQGALWAGVSKASDEDAKRAEARGFPIVAIVLLVVFGSVAAAAL